MERQPEVWKQVPAFPKYEVSSLGRIRSDYSGTRRGGECLVPWPAGKGYLQVMLYRDAAPTKVYMHRVVCEAFHGPCPSPDHEAAHWDRCVIHNEAANLRWATRLENEADKVRHDTMTRGERSAHAKITEATARQIVTLLEDGLPARQIADRLAGLSVTLGIVRQIKGGYSWAWLRGAYYFRRSSQLAKAATPSMGTEA